MSKATDIGDDVFLYAVRNSDGQWFRAKGQSGYGQTWVDNFVNARIYQRIGPARACVSFFANKWPDFPTPVIVKLSIGKIEIIDEKERVAKQKASKERQEAARKQREAEYEHRYALQRLEQAQRDVARLGGVVKKSAKKSKS